MRELTGRCRHHRNRRWGDELARRHHRDPDDFVELSASVVNL